MSLLDERVFITLNNVRVRKEHVSFSGQVMYKEWKLYELIVPADKIAGLFKMDDGCYIDARVQLPYAYDEMKISQEDYDKACRILGIREYNM